MSAYIAPSVLLPDGWADDVRIEVDATGRIADIDPGVGAREGGAERLRGPVLPGMANLHSHAFQRAIAGRAERRGPGEDSFWSWRDTMYHFVAALEPEDVEAIALHLYVEMLRRGYTTVAEFHYLHHDRAGAPYDPPTEMSERVLGAARAAGVAITHLPVLYAHGDFGGTPPGEDQRRFVNDPERYARLLEDLTARRAGEDGMHVGIALHSLRAVTEEEIGRALRAIDAIDARAPIHVHVAEQEREVEACLAWSGARPVEWLLDHAPIDERWCLVHATHVTEEETARLAASGAVAGLCPTTEANLGDGIFPAVDYAARGGALGIGSDSHVTVDPAAELRLLEYGQRLRHRRRALLADADTPSVGRWLWTRAAEGGARACGIDAGSIEVGRRADLLVLDPEAPALASTAGDAVLDAWLFAADESPVRDVIVGGRRVVEDGTHPAQERARAGWRAALRRIGARAAV